MALRVTQRNMYTNMIGRMNNNLSAYMKTHEQSSSQKKVNRPSDDPYGASQIMHSYTQLNAINSYKDNLSMATGWLKQADNALSMVNTSMEKLIGLLEQGSTGTYNAEQRKDMGMQARQILEQMLTYANADFNGRYLFGGHKTDSSAYVLAHHAHSNHPDMAGVEYSVKGNPAYTTIIQFTQNGNLDDVPPPEFRYSQDGGDTWQTGTWSAGPPQAMHCGPDVAIELDNIAGVPVQAVDPANIKETDNGTWVYVRPTAEYKGDTNNPSVVQSYPYTNPVGAEASGVFNRDVAVRIDRVDGGKIFYSYSTDDGSSWTAGEAADTNPRKLYVAGGFLNLDATPTVPSQYIIRPHRADINLNIGPNGATLTINNIGCDIFGGLYAPPFSNSGAQPVMENNLDSNLFEVLGKAVGYLETNNQSGCQEALDAINNGVASQISQARTSLGARINRADEIKFQLEQKVLDENDRLSSLEDADLSELMTRMAQQELAYRTVLQSSSMIMQISLINFL